MVESYEECITLGCHNQVLSASDANPCVEAGYEYIKVCQDCEKQSMEDCNQRLAEKFKPIRSMNDDELRQVGLQIIKGEQEGDWRAAINNFVDLDPKISRAIECPLFWSEVTICYRQYKNKVGKYSVTREHHDLRDFKRVAYSSPTGYKRAIVQACIYDNKDALEWLFTTYNPDLKTIEAICQGPDGKWYCTGRVYLSDYLLDWMLTREEPAVKRRRIEESTLKNNKEINTIKEILGLGEDGKISNPNYQNMVNISKMFFGEH